MRKRWCSFLGSKTFPSLKSFVAMSSALSCDVTLQALCVWWLLPESHSGPIVRGGSETCMSWSNWVAIPQSAQACLNSNPLRGGGGGGPFELYVDHNLGSLTSCIHLLLKPSFFVETKKLWRKAGNKCESQHCSACNDLIHNWLCNLFLNKLPPQQAKSNYCTFQGALCRLSQWALALHGSTWSSDVVLFFCFSFYF